MPTWSKVVLAFGAAVVVVVLAYLGGKHWWEANRGRLRQLGDRMRTEGKAFGEKSNAEDCVNEALRRLDDKGSFFEHAGQRTFLKWCLASAYKPPGFCDRVPRPGEIMKTALWANVECERRVRGNNQCTNVMQAVADYCWPDK